MHAPQLRIGVLGAARIAPAALIRPARYVAGVTVAAIAARDPQRGAEFARRYEIARVHETYDQLLRDPEIDAVYNPLPNHLHCEWTVRALAAGKHVLCEKPLAANVEEAQLMAEAARSSGRVLMEAFHFRYHPLAARMKAILDGGELGAVTDFEVRFAMPFLNRNDIRFRFELAGGATMDLGCYAINLIRYLSGEDPEVTNASALLLAPHLLVATTPRMEGRSFGTNVIEAVCRCLIDKPESEITDADFIDLIERIPLLPQVHVLNPHGSDAP